MNLKGLFGTRLGIISVGAFIGILATLLQKLDNPPNMGVCVACFERDREFSCFGISISLQTRKVPYMMLQASLSLS